MVVTNLQIFTNVRIIICISVQIRKFVILNKKPASKAGTSADFSVLVLGRAYALRLPAVFGITNMLTNS